MAMVLWAAKVLFVLNLLFDQSPSIILLFVFQCWNLPALYNNSSVSLPTQANEQELVYHSCCFIFTVVIQKDGHLTLLVDIVKYSWTMIHPLRKRLANQNVTPLITAAIRGHLKVVNLLLEKVSGLIELPKANRTTIAHTLYFPGTGNLQTRQSMYLHLKIFLAFPEIGFWFIY